MLPGYLVLGAIGIVTLFGLAAMYMAMRKEWARYRTSRARQRARRQRDQVFAMHRAYVESQRQPEPQVGLTDVFERLEESVRFARPSTPMPH